MVVDIENDWVHPCALNANHLDLEGGVTYVIQTFWTKKLAQLTVVA